jgi:hypothetical protein
VAGCASVVGRWCWVVAVASSTTRDIVDFVSRMASS